MAEEMWRRWLQTGSKMEKGQADVMLGRKRSLLSMLRRLGGR